MGYLCEVHCPSCGFRQVFKLGSGRKDYNQKRIYSHFDMMEVWSIKVAVVEKKSRFLTFHYRLGTCRDCGRLMEVPEVIFEDGSAYHSSMCSCDLKKEHEIELFMEDTDGDVKCPKCGKKLHLQRKGLWD